MGAGRSSQIASRAGSLQGGASGLHIVCSLLAGLALLVACGETPPTMPSPPGGGGAYVLDRVGFEQEVAAVLQSRGCDAVACHGGGIRGTYALSAPSAKDLDFDYAQSSLQVRGEDPGASPLLLKPLAEAAGGVAHAADPALSGFTAADDPDYLLLRAWVLGGETR